MRESTFRALWSASLVANLGTWAQTVGGAWLMTTLTSDALPVALMQSAVTLPALLLGLPAGSLADRIDRRKLLLATQSWMLFSAAALALVTMAGLVQPWLLLALTFSLGIGSALSSPTWSSLLPDVVSRPQLPMAVITNSLGYNVARAVGPTFGGVLFAVVGPAGTFIANALSFAAPIGVLARMRPLPRPPKPTSGESFFGTVRSGLTYVRQDPVQRVVLMRSILWMLCASALWSLLPLVARYELGLDVPGYGFLVTCVGGGAVLGAMALPALRQRWQSNQLLMGAVVIFSLMLLVLAWVRVLPVVLVMLALGGAAWTQSNQNFQIAVQLGAPGFVRARAIAMYLLTFQGGQAVGSAIWGSAAEQFGDSLALTIAALGVALSLVAAVRWPVKDPV
ncbi:MAG TPA: MFS transporter [Chloroflexota bacterium]|nr:MFS transporter [Chloroflexota bacterium]